MGSPRPVSNYIASDADYVDYITELMGGFAIPNFLKEYRKGKKYLLIGLPQNRDSERMVMNDIVYAASERKAGCCGKTLPRRNNASANDWGWKSSWPTAVIF